MDFNKNIIKDIQKSSKSWFEENGSKIGGTLAVLFGVWIVLRSGDLIFNLVFFLFGLGLMYYGLKLLKVTKITNFIDAQLERVLNKFRSMF
ncbi:hypothetical protein KAW80_04250 [Candidatus Babeliales bacterium]|nr:hypothetical protein [Candidatus Babeliales bacterium]